MHLYENIEAERDRIEACIKKYGWTSDHNLDWFADSMIDETGKAMFAEFEDGTGILFYRYPEECSIWSDPLSKKDAASEKIKEFYDNILNEKIKKVWCIDVSDNLKSELLNHGLEVAGTYYSLLWPVLDMEKYDANLPGGHFKEIRNARNKFYKEHKVEIIEVQDSDRVQLHRIVNTWKEVALKKQKKDIYELKYHKAIDNIFKGFKTARVLCADGNPVGFNAGYEVPNMQERFAGIIGIHDYSFKDLGIILWLEDLDWVKKNTKYKFYDMQGSEDDKSLHQKMIFNPIIERKTDTFSIVKNKTQNL